MAGGGIPTDVPGVAGGYLSGKKLIYPLSLVISLFFLWGFSYGLLDVLNKHFQTVLGVTRLESTGLQVMYFGGGYLCFSPIAAEVLKRKGYKVTILMGLTLYSLGAIFFWPVAHFSTPTNEKAAFGGFLACTFVIACGLATLETSANSYAVVIGHPATASARLQFCQSWNGVASFTGPLIASKAFFSGENANSLTNVQYVYLAVACAGVAVGVLFFFSKLPEVSESAGRSASIVAGDSEELGLPLDQFGNIIAQKPLYKEYNMIFGFCAQFAYVGAQVTIATFFINYATEAASYSSEEGARLLSYGLIVFTVGRFIAAGVAYFLESNFVLMIYAAVCIALTAYVSTAHGTAGVACIIVIFFFMAPMYPSIFTIGTANLGRNTRRGAGILVMGVSGGAVFPPIQGAIADSSTTRISYLVPMVGFIVVLAYVTTHWFRHGMHILRIKGENVVATALEGGAVGGAVQTVHYDEKRLSFAEIEQVRRSSLAGAAVNPMTGGYRVEADHDAGLDRRSSITGRMNATFGGYNLKGNREDAVEQVAK
jgi:FHS family L-fucose permease-like MFS transporter